MTKDLFCVYTMASVGLLRRLTPQLCSKSLRCRAACPWILKSGKRCLSTTKCLFKSEDRVDDKPIKYSTSEARQWQSINTFEMPERTKKMPPYQPYSVVLSLLVFLVYFAILREENDVDELLGVSLYDRMPGLEEKNIRIAIEHEKRIGKSTVDLERRLKQLEDATE